VTDKRGGWFAYRPNGTREYARDERPRRPPGVPDPDEGGVRIRMFVDDVSGQGLWLRPFSRYREATLPISDDLRARIEGWVDDYTRSITELGPFNAVEHDRRGLALSEELAAELGDGFLVDYHFHTRRVREEHQD
jgi:hypothetical protein